MDDSVNYFISEFLLNLNKYNALAVLIPLITALAVLIGKRYKRFYDFKEPFLPFMHLVETGQFPENRFTYTEFITQNFLAQDNAMFKIRDRLKTKCRDIFDQKWTTYKEKRKGYNEPYWDAKLLNIVKRQVKDKEILNLINEILEIAKNN